MQPKLHNYKQKYNDGYKSVTSKILDLAIHGKLVPQDPNDEPASVLLERIKAEKERLIKEGKIKRSKKSAKSSDTPHYENVPFEVPSSWVWTNIEELFLLLNLLDLSILIVSRKIQSPAIMKCL